MFAEPGSDDAAFTTDTAAFLAAQTAALRARVAEQSVGEQKVLLAELHKDRTIRIPNGFEATHGNPEQPKPSETVLFAVQTLPGYDFGKVIARVVRKLPAKGSAKTAPKVDVGDGDDDEDTDEVRAPQPPKQRAPEDAISPRGMAIITREKVKALDAQIAATEGRPLDLTLALVLIQSGVDFVVRRIVPPEGGACLTLDDIGPLANDWLLNSMRGLDDCAEWIGQAIGADSVLPRFDTPEFLACVSGAELRRLAVAAKLKPAKTTPGLRKQLAGALPDWRPAVFGAPGPKPPAAPKPERKGKA